MSQKQCSKSLFSAVLDSTKIFLGFFFGYFSALFKDLLTPVHLGGLCAP